MATTRPGTVREVTHADVASLAWDRYRVPSRSGGPPHEVNTADYTCTCPAFARAHRPCWALRLLSLCPACGGPLYNHEGRRGGEPTTRDYIACRDPECGWRRWLLHAWEAA